MQAKILTSSLGFVFLLFSSVVSAELIASWNVKHLGWADEKRDWVSTAKVVANFDFIALQEVHTEASVSRLTTMLNQMTDFDWAYSISAYPVGSKKYKEFYAVVWNRSTIKHDGGDVVYLDPERKFIREPYLAKFSTRNGHNKWTMASIHVIYGDKKSQRIGEASFLDEFALWAKETVSPNRSLLVMGDFNLPPKSEGFDGLRKFMAPMITSGKTTLRKVDGEYKNLYDNIWAEGRTLNIVGRGIYKFPQELQLSHEHARKKVSDHAPVYIQVK